MSVVTAALYATPQVTKRPRHNNGRHSVAHSYHRNPPDYSNPSNKRLQQETSTLTVNLSELLLNADTQVTLGWNIKENVNPLDWIGLYLLGEKNPFRYLDYRSHGVCSQSKGSLQWQLGLDLINVLRPKVLLHKGAKSARCAACCVEPHRMFFKLTLCNSLICILKRFNWQQTSPKLPGNRTTAESSPPKSIVKFLITNIGCTSLRRNFLPPNFQVTLLLQPSNIVLFKGEGQSNINPEWKSLKIEFVSETEQSLYFEVKDKSRPRFHQNVGHCVISTAKIFKESVRMSNSWVRITLNLRSKQNKNNQSSDFTGPSLIFTVNVTDKNNCESNPNVSSATEVNRRGSTVAPAPTIANLDEETTISDDNDNWLPGRSQKLKPFEQPAINLGESGYTTDSNSSSDDRMPRKADNTKIDRFVETPCSGKNVTVQSHSSDSGISQQTSTGSSDHTGSRKSGTSLLGNQPNSCSFDDDDQPGTSGGTLTVHHYSRTQSVPQTPVKSPRFHRPDTLNIFCSECLAKSSHNSSKIGNTNNHKALSRSNSAKALQSFLASTLKNSISGTLANCSRCDVLKSHYSKPSNIGALSKQVGGNDRRSLDLLLPALCEARVDAHGRIFYVDHLNKTTSWCKPRGANGCMRRQSEKIRRQQIDRRYKCMRKTVGSALGRVEAKLLENDQAPAVMFITRQDFTSFLHSSEVAKEIYDSSESVRHIIHRVRKDPSKFERYQFNKDLVALLNEFADRSQSLPQDWEAKVDPNGKEFFVDHKNKRTTFIDPRLPIAIFNQRRQRARSAPTDSDEEELTYNERVVNFLRQPDSVGLINSRLPPSCNQTKLKRKLDTICKVGVPALKKYANDVDLIMVLSCCEQEILSDQKRKAENLSCSGSKEKDFDAKLADFYLRLCERGYGQGPSKVRLVIKRERLLKDAFEQIMSISKKDLQRSKLNICFDDEDGLDYGGPSREFFFLLSRELFNPYYGLFEYSANDTYTVQISPMSIFVENNPDWFRFSGRVLGLALMHRFLIDAFFTRAFYKFLLRVPCSVTDLESLDSQFHSSLLWLQDNEVTADLELTFSVNEDVAGELVERMLKPGGDEIRVNEQNKSEYIERMVKWRLDRGVKKQSSAVLQGFYEVIDPSLVRVFDARELELVLSGTIEIDIGDWRQNTEYKGGYHDEHIVIFWFWQAIERFSNSQRLLVLQFVTGTSSIPCEGFVALRGSHGPKKFTIEKWGCPASLPRAHTCFNRLDLPPYPSFNVLYQKLLMAIEESSAFGIE